MPTQTMIPISREVGNLWDVPGELAEMFDTGVEVMQRTTRRGLWHPVMDVYNRPEEILVEMELPGVNMSDISLRLRANHLVIEGTRKRPSEMKEDEEFYSERYYGSFHRVIHLPTEVEAEKAQASFREGLLVIRLPKSGSVEGRSIEIKQG